MLLFDKAQGGYYPDHMGRLRANHQTGYFPLDVPHSQLYVFRVQTKDGDEFDFTSSMFNTDIISRCLPFMDTARTKTCTFHVGRGWIETCIEFVRRLLKVKYEKLVGEYPMDDIKVIMISTRSCTTALLKDFDKPIEPLQLYDPDAPTTLPSTIKMTFHRKLEASAAEYGWLVPHGFKDILDRRAGLINRDKFYAWTGTPMPLRLAFEQSPRKDQSRPTPPPHHRPPQDLTLVK